MPVVKFYEAFVEEEAAIRRHMPPDIDASFSAKTIQEEGDASAAAGVISVRTQSAIPDGWRKDLRGILTRSAGYDHLRNIRKAVPCGYLPDYCARAVAEQAVLMLMALMRRLRSQMRHFETFDRDHLTGVECRGRRLLVVGVGRIGGEAVDIGRGLGMDVRGVDIAPRRKDVEFVSLEEGMPWADAVICAVPLTERTRAMFRYDAFGRGRRGAFFVNIARGEISPLADLQRALDDGRLAGVGLDVFENEGLLAAGLRRGETSGDPKRLRAFVEDERVIVTPHNAFNTVESVERKAALSVEAVKQFLGTGAFPNPVPGDH